MDFQFFIENPDHRDQVYTEFLETLSLNQDHEKQLKEKRLLDQSDIDRVSYRTYPKGGSSKRILDICDNLQNDFGLRGVPGFWKRDDIKAWGIMPVGSDCLAIPIRDWEGRINGIRLKTEYAGGKYLPLSTNVNKYPMGTMLKTGLLMYWPNQKNSLIKEAKALRITEGEFKAEIATKMTDTYTIGTLGANNLVNLINEYHDLWFSMGVREIQLAFDSDKDSHTYGGNGKTVGEFVAAGYELLRTKGKIRPVIEHWEIEEGKGIDDVLLDGDKNAIIKWSDVDAQAWVNAKLDELSPFKWLMMRHLSGAPLVETSSIISNRSKYGIKMGTSINYLRADEFTHSYAHKRQRAYDSLAQDPNLMRIDGSGYYPGEKMFIENEHRMMLNDWCPYLVDPMEGDITPFTEYLNSVYQDPQEQHILLSFLASCYKRPAKMIPWMPVIYSKEKGTGKSLLLELVMCPILGRNCYLAAQNDVKNITQWNEWMAGKSLLGFEEFMMDGRVEMSEFFRGTLTATTVNIRERRVNTRKIPKKFNMIATLNRLNNILMDGDERRYRWIGATKFITDSRKHANYFDRLTAWLAVEENLSAIAFWFDNWDFKEFDKEIFENIHTKTTEKAIKSVTTQSENKLTEMAEEMEYPFNMPIIRSKHLKEFLKKTGEHRLARNNNLISDIMTERGYTNKQFDFRSSDLGQIRFWVREGDDAVKGKNPAQILSWWTDNHPKLLQEYVDRDLLRSTF